MPHALDILAANALIYGAGVLTGFNLAPPRSPASCWEEGDPENGSRALSLKAALAGEIKGGRRRLRCAQELNGWANAKRRARSWVGFMNMAQTANGAYAWC
jgi:hypothetical protein